MSWAPSVRLSLLTNVHDAPANRPPPAVLPQIDPLPRAERETPILKRNRKGRRRESRLDMGRHVVGTLERMREVRIVLRYETVEPPFQVTASGWIRVLLDREAGGGVLHHESAQPFPDHDVGHHGLDTVRELEQLLPRRGYLDVRHHLKPGALYVVTATDALGAVTLD